MRSSLDRMGSSFGSACGGGDTAGFSDTFASAFFSSLGCSCWTAGTIGSAGGDDGGIATEVVGTSASVVYWSY